MRAVACVRQWLLLALLLALAAQAKSRSLTTSRSALQSVKKLPLRRSGSGSPIVASAGSSSFKAARGVSPFFASIVAGAAAGTAVDLVLYPLDTIKTRLQSTATMKWSMSLLSNAYAGVLPGIAASAPASAAFLGAYDVVSAKMAANYRVPFVVGKILAACVGDVAHSVVRAPFEVVKQRMQAGIDVTTEAAVKNIYAANGVSGFFSGAAALALRDLPFDVIQFPIYESLKVALARQLRRPLTTWELAFCGFLAGGVAAALTTPLDVVKTRYLTQPKLYNGMLTCFLTVWRQDGMKGLFAGVGPRLAIIALGGAIYFGVYEAVKEALQPKPEVYAAAASSSTTPAGISSAPSSTYKPTSNVSA